MDLSTISTPSAASAQKAGDNDKNKQDSAINTATKPETTEHAESSATDVHTEKVCHSLEEALQNKLIAKVLYINETHMSSLPAAIGELTELRELNLRFNQLTGLPAEIGKLKKLEILVLAANPIQSLPAAVNQLDTRKTSISKSKADQFKATLQECEVKL